jgi:hypothetical protein
VSSADCASACAFTDHERRQVQPAHDLQLVVPVRKRALDQGFLVIPCDAHKIPQLHHAFQLAREGVDTLASVNEWCEIARVSRKQKPAMAGLGIHHHLLQIDDADSLLVRPLNVRGCLHQSRAAELSDRVQRGDESGGQRNDDRELPPLERQHRRTPLRDIHADPRTVV